MVREWSVCLGGEPLSVARTCINICMHWCVLVFKSDHTYGHMEESYRRLKNYVYPINLFVLSFIGMKSIFYDQISAKLKKNGHKLFILPNAMQCKCKISAKESYGDTDMWCCHSCMWIAV